MLLKSTCTFLTQTILNALSGKSWCLHPAHNGLLIILQRRLYKIIIMTKNKPSFDRVDYVCGRRGLGRGEASTVHDDTCRRCWPAWRRGWPRWGSGRGRCRSCSPDCAGCQCPSADHDTMAPTQTSALCVETWVLHPLQKKREINN